MELKAHTSTIADSSVLALDGVVDLSTLPTFHDLLRRHVAEHDHPVVDLDGVVALDDCGLGLLLGAAGRCRETGRELVIVTTRWRDRLAITGMDRAVTVRATPIDGGREIATDR